MSILKGDSQTKRRTRIVWTEEERISVARRVAELQNKSPRTGLTVLLDTAQKDVLTEKRHRPIRPNMVADMRPFIKAALQEVAQPVVANEPAEELAESAVETPVAALEAPALPEVAPEPINAYETAFKPVLDLVKAELLPALIPALRDALVPELRKLLKEMFVVGDAKKEEVKHAQVEDKPVLPAGIERRRKPKIAVIGGKRQMHVLMEDTYTLIDFAFVSQDMPTPIEQVKACDIGMVLADYCTHTQVAQAKKALKDKTMTRISGGLRQALRQIEIWLMAGVVQLPHKEK